MDTYWYWNFLEFFYYGLIPDCLKLNNNVLFSKGQ